MQSFWYYARRYYETECCCCFQFPRLFSLFFLLYRLRVRLRVARCCHALLRCAELLRGVLPAQVCPLKRLVLRRLLARAAKVTRRLYPHVRSTCAREKSGRCFWTKDKKKKMEARSHTNILVFVRSTRKYRIAPTYCP